MPHPRPLSEKKGRKKTSKEKENVFFSLAIPRETNLLIIMNAQN
jgi:hypothetical protein